MADQTETVRVFKVGQEVRDASSGVVYCITRFIGRGGMGEVYEVMREDTAQRFALKCLQAQLARDPKILRRAWHEASALRDLVHPNVVRVHAVGVQEPGTIWMVMDLLVGHTLRQLLDELNKLPLPWALRVMRDAALGLAAVHGFAVHRDVKPENIHLGRDAVVRVLDLGAGKFHHLGLTTTGQGTIGTVPYMSPEQIRTPEAIDNRSDIFSAGVVLFELVSGKHPFAPGGLDRVNVFGLVADIVGNPHTPLGSVAPWAPADVAAIVERCLAKDRAQRYANAAELAQALDAALSALERVTGATPPLTTLTEALHRLGAVRSPHDPVRARADTLGPGDIDVDASTVALGERGERD